jgi:acid phosphatase type 7
VKALGIKAALTAVAGASCAWLIGASCTPAETVATGQGAPTTSTSSELDAGLGGGGGAAGATSDAGPGGGGAGGSAPSELPASYPDAGTLGMVRGPYLQNVTDTAVTVMWEAAEACAGYVETWSTDGYAVHGPDPFAARHEVALSGLPAHAAELEYRFRCLAPADADPAGSPAAAVIGSQETLRLAPAVAEPFRLALYGDSQANPAVHTQVVASVMGILPNLLIHLGDEVDDGGVYAQWDEQFFGPIQPLAKAVPFFVAIGNHENNAANFYDLHAQPSPENYFAFTYGNSYNIVVDANELSGLVSPEQILWLGDRLASPEALGAEWLLVYGHQPPYSEMWGAPGYDGTSYMRDVVLPMLNAAGVDIYFSGHAHGYQRGESGGTVLVVSGGGGGALDQVQQDLSAIDLSLAVHHFVQVDIAGPHLELRAVDTTGATIDTLTIDK